MKEKIAASTTPFSSLVGSVIWHIQKNQHTRRTLFVSSFCYPFNQFKFFTDHMSWYPNFEFGDCTVIICNIKDFNSPNIPANSVFYIREQHSFSAILLCLNGSAFVLNVCSEKGTAVQLWASFVCHPVMSLMATAKTETRHLNILQIPKDPSSDSPFILKVLGTQLLVEFSISWNGWHINSWWC